MYNPLWILGNLETTKCLVESTFWYPYKQLSFLPDLQQVRSVFLCFVDRVVLANIAEIATSKQFSSTSVAQFFVASSCIHLTDSKVPFPAVMIFEPGGFCSPSLIRKGALIEPAHLVRSGKHNAASSHLPKPLQYVCPIILLCRAPVLIWTAL